MQLLKYLSAYVKAPSPESKFLQADSVSFLLLLTHFEGKLLNLNVPGL